MKRQSVRVVVASEHPGVRAVTSENGATYSTKTIEDSMPLVIRGPRRTKGAGNPLFTNIEAKAEALPRTKATTPGDIAIFSGALGLALGWVVTVTWISATVGVAIAGAGVAVMLLGVAGKLVAPAWCRLLRRKQ